MKNKFEIGDKVEVIRYGHLIRTSKSSRIELPVIHEEENSVWRDMLSDIVGRVGVIKKVTETQGESKYSIDGIYGKTAWYDEEQLEMAADLKK